MNTKCSWLVFLFVLLGVSFFRFGPTSINLAEKVQWTVAYPFTVVAMVAFCLVFWWQYRASMLRLSEFWRPGLVLAFALLMVHYHEPHFLKVTNDEQFHLGVAYGVYRDDRLCMIMAGHFSLEGLIPIDSYSSSFRGHFFSFLVGVFSKIVGFYEVNAYIVNGFLGGVVLVALYFITLRLANLGRMLSVVPSIFLLGTPIFGQVMNSGSYDMSNLALLSLMLLFILQLFHEESMPRSGDVALVLVAGVLLAYCRAESSAYFAIGLIFILWRCNWRMPWGASVALIFLVPVMSTQLLLMSNSTNLTQGQDADKKSVWSFSNLLENWSDSLLHFLNFGPTKLGSFLLFLLGLLGLVGILLGFRTFEKQRRAAIVVLLIFFVVSLVLYSLVMGLFWGGAASALVMTRFTLPIWLALAIFSAFAIERIVAVVPQFKKCIAPCAFLWFLFFSVPAYENKIVLSAFDAAIADRELVRLARSENDGRTLFVYASAGSFVSRGLPCVEYSYFSSNIDTYIKMAKMGAWDRIVFAEVETVGDPAGKDIKYHRLWDRFRKLCTTTTVAQKRIDAAWTLKLSRWDGVMLDGSLVDVRTRSDAFPAHTNHSNLMIKFRQMVPLSYGPRDFVEEDVKRTMKTSNAAK